MSSVAVSGKPGGSKSYYAFRYRILEELLNGTRPIVTNLEVELDELARYLRRIGRTDIKLCDRIQILEYSQVKEFWRYRGPGADPLPPISAESAKQGVRPDFSQVKDGGVLYVLDELHEHLNAREWSQTGPLVLFYAAKHRHLGDDIIWITQAIENVDKQWRSITQEYIYCRNFGKERFGVFRKGEGFEAVAYLSAFTGSQAEQWVHRYKLDKTVAKCYKTSVYGKRADVGEKVKGLPIWVLVLLIFVAGGVVLWLLNEVPKFLTSGGKKVKNAPAAVVVPQASPSPSPTASPVPSATPGPLAVVGSPAQPASHSAVIVPPGLVATPSPTPRVMHVIAVPLRFSTADAVRSGLAMDKAAGTDVTVYPTGDNSALICSGDDMQNVVAVAQLVRLYDVRCAMVSVHCVIARRQVTKGCQIGLFGFLQDLGQAADQTTGSAGGGAADYQQLLSSLAYDLSTGVATMGGIYTARMGLDAFTRFVASDDRYEVVSHPSLVMLSGRQAQFSSGRQIPVPTTVNTASGSQTSVEYKEADFSFKVTPTVLPDGRVHLEISQSNTDVLSTVVVAGSQVPTLSTQSLQSSVDLGDRQLLYLGGIMVDTASKTDTGTPVLRKIPVVNWVFGSRQHSVEREELFVVVTAEVWRGHELPVRVERAQAVHDSTSSRLEDLWSKVQ